MFRENEREWREMAEIKILMASEISQGSLSYTHTHTQTHTQVGTLAV